MVRTRERVRQLRAKGWSITRIAQEIGLSKSTMGYHCRRLGEKPDDRFNRRYDGGAIQQYYDAGHSIPECQERFGFARCTWVAAARRGAVVSRPQAMPVERLLIGKRSRTHVKNRLIAAGLLDAASCAACGISEWQGTPLSRGLRP